MTAEELTARLGGVWNGNEGSAGCPAHEDQHPSLSIGTGDDGRILVHCHALCPQQKVLDKLRSMGLWDSPKHDKASKREQPEIIAGYVYRDENGNPRYQVLRWSNKKFTQQRAVGKGFFNGIEGVERLPYLLPEFLKAPKDVPVFLPEGEKDVESLIDELKLVASCNSGGATHWQPELTKWFEGRDCVILPDNDLPGRKHAVVVGEALSGVAKRVRVLALPDLAEHGDVSDWIEAGGTRKQLLLLAASAPDFAAWRADYVGLPEGLVLQPGDPVSSAKAFLNAEYKDDRLLCHAGLFYEWRRSHYATIDDAGVEAALYKFLAMASRPSKNGIAPFQPDKKKVGDVMHALRSLVYVAGTLAPPCWLDGRGEGERFLACRNGLLRLRDEVLLPHDPEYFNPSAVGFDYESDPPEPVEWLKFLRSVWPGASGDDLVCILAVQEQFGYALSGDRRRQKIILHVGPKRAGKGVILRTLLKLMGNDAHVGLSLSGLATERFALEPLIGKQLAAVPDARSVGRSGQVVELLLAVSGGDELTVPRKYRTAVTVRLNCLFWMLSNVVPRLLDASGTIASRFIVVQYRNSFYGREDLDLERRLDKELPGILKWAVAGYRALERQGRFTQPESGLPAVRTMRLQSSTIIEFIESKYVLGPKGKVPTTELFNAFRVWFADTNQSGHPGNESSFGAKLNDAFPQLTRRRDGVRRDGQLVRWYTYKGLRKRDANFDDPAC